MKVKISFPPNVVNFCGSVARNKEATWCFRAVQSWTVILPLRKSFQVCISGIGHAAITLLANEQSAKRWVVVLGSIFCEIKEATCKKYRACDRIHLWYYYIGKLDPRELFMILCFRFNNVNLFNASNVLITSLINIYFFWKLW